MKCNVGKTDRIGRYVAGVAILAAGAYFRSWWGLLGVGPIVTATIRWCPAYVPLGVSTDKPS